MILGNAQAYLNFRFVRSPDLAIRALLPIRRPRRSLAVIVSFQSAAECSASTGLLKEFALPPSIFASKDVRPFTIFTEFMNKPPRQKASGQDTNGKKANSGKEDS